MQILLVVESILAAKRTKFGRNGGMTDIPGSGVSYLTSTEVYREYTLNRKRRGGYVGHHEQVLAIDGDYVRIMPTSTRTMLFDSGKTASYLKNTIYDCRQSRKAPSSFKLIVIRGDREKKTYEFEAHSPKESRKWQNECFIFLVRSFSFRFGVWDRVVQTKLGKVFIAHPNSMFSFLFSYP